MSDVSTSQQQNDDAYCTQHTAQKKKVDDHHEIQKFLACCRSCYRLRFSGVDAHSSWVFSTHRRKEFESRELLEGSGCAMECESSSSSLRCDHELHNRRTGRLVDVARRFVSSAMNLPWAEPRFHLKRKHYMWFTGWFRRCPKVTGICFRRLPAC